MTNKIVIKQKNVFYTLINWSRFHAGNSYLAQVWPNFPPQPPFFVSQKGIVEG